MLKEKSGNGHSNLPDKSPNQIYVILNKNNSNMLLTHIVLALLRFGERYISMGLPELESGTHCLKGNYSTN